MIGRWADMFQFTLPRGERLDDAEDIVEVDEVSIHAPARGATQFLTDCCEFFSVSIHAPARGATYRSDH